MSRLALGRQGQNSHVCTRWHAMAGRGLTLALPHGAGPGYRPISLDVHSCTDRRKALLPTPTGGAGTRGEDR
jgi:hypothetical protein